MPILPETPLQPPGSSAGAEPPVAFAQLGVAPDLVAVLHSLGIRDAFPIQALTLPDALAGRDVCGKAETGSGKTLAFGIPVIQRSRPAAAGHPRSLVLVPTRELANQIATALAPLARRRGLRVLAIYGGVSLVRQMQALRSKIDLVVATPGRLNDLLDRGALSLQQVEQVVLDEADQMADMGFLPQVERILGRVQGPAQMLLFSATLDDAVSTLVRRYQHDPVHHQVASATTTVERVEEKFVEVDLSAKVQVTADLCRSGGRTLVFVRTTHGADRLSKQLANLGVMAGRIHGRLSQSQRERELRAFMEGSTLVLVATNIAARGIHIDGVDLVLHYDLPEDHKTYIHRSGRTARAGASGLVITLVLPHERDEVRRLRGEHVAPVAARRPELRAHDPRRRPRNGYRAGARS